MAEADRTHDEWMALRYCGFSNRLPGIRLIASDSYRELHFPTASARREFMNRVKRLLAAQILSVWVGAAFGPPDRR